MQPLELPTFATFETVALLTPPSSGPNTYDYHSCTWWVKNWKPDIGPLWGNANLWGYAARAEGWTVSSNPVVGAVAWTTGGYYGHVGLVLAVNGNTVTVREGNYDWGGSVRVYDYPVSYFQYIYR